MAKRLSPDSVICIDLTGDDDERETKLGDVRKRLKGTASVAATHGSTQVATGAATSAAVKTEGQASRDDDDDDDGGGKIGSCAVLQQRAMSMELDPSSEVEIVAPVALTLHAVASAQAEYFALDDDIVLVGTVNESRLPHMRQHCTEHKFSRDAEFQAKNKNIECCGLCFCYVCDVPVAKCTIWTTHCNASDTGVRGPVWKRLRDERKQQASMPAGQRSTAALPRFGHSTAHDRGPFEPGNKSASRDSCLTKCRKCGWYNRFDHRNFTNYSHQIVDWRNGKPMMDTDFHPTGFRDWCHSCGRVASEKDFGKVQSTEYVRVPGDVFLGERIIRFRIKAHDPRKFEKFSEKWTTFKGSDTRWTFSEAEMEEDVFSHRLGKYPSIEMILASVPIVAEDKIPEIGSLYLISSQKDDEEPSADETEAIIIENPNEITLLRELAAFETIGHHKRKKKATVLDGDITAAWNSADRSGTLSIRVYIQPRAAQGSSPHEGSFSRTLGAWFGIFPFPLAELCGPLHARNPGNDSASERSIPMPPFTLPADVVDGKVADAVARAIENHNAQVQTNLAVLSLNSSTRMGHLGGKTNGEVDLAGCLKRYFAETIFEDMIQSEASYHARIYHPFAAIDQGVQSFHRCMRRSGERILGESRFSTLRYPSYCRREDYAVARLLKCSVILKATTSLKGSLDHLENLHHASVQYVDGLNVELLDFQRQSVQWALERETTEGGVQSFLWPKLPSVAEPGQELYFSPVLDRFRRDKPQLVRGGIIAEEMGLGKTVISLALILKNTAPPTPQSGSPITALNSVVSSTDATTNHESLWDRDLHARTSVANSKRGTILSRGTLVVCPVSLVGQWIDEARSKLKEPGLVYPYHGQSRKRDAAMLAANAIVVTTYQTLASDATYHANKAGVGYCAPCEQVRWWRIICDESHSLREGNTKKSSAVMCLVADNKWVVSGTPVSSSFNDLKNQLKFIGIENIEEIFKEFGSTALRHCNDPYSRKGRNHVHPIDEGRKIGHFMFFLRSLVMRHTQKQTYRNTTTTLMSLPPKVKRSILVDFSAEERHQYAALDIAAREFYVQFKRQKGHELSKHHLLLASKLMPLRIAASGGPIPLDDDDELDPETASKDTDDEPVADARKKKSKKQQKFSDFVYTNKLKALLKCLKRARDEDPNSKSLVFSQFTSTLGWLQQELPKHGFQFRTLSGDMSMRKRAKALHDFQHDPPTTVFLLSMRAGAVGINLTQANRVFLMEPSFNPALEAQAIGRVHRLGQKRNVEIVRFSMKDSVETRILEMLKKRNEPSASSNEKDGESDKRSPKVTAAPLVGSLVSDKTTVLAREFDILFGTRSSSGPASALKEEQAEPESQPSTSVNI